MLLQQCRDATRHFIDAVKHAKLLHELLHDAAAPTCRMQPADEFNCCSAAQKILPQMTKGSC